MGKQPLENSASPGAQLLLSPGTTVRCPACEQEFSLEQGFAKKALEHLEEHSRGALAAMESQVKHEVERRAAAIAAERQGAAQQQIAQLEQLIEQQSQSHAKALGEVRSLAERDFAPRLQALRAELAASDDKLKALGEREAALTARGRGLESSVATAARLKADWPTLLQFRLRLSCTAAPRRTTPLWSTGIRVTASLSEAHALPRCS